MPLLRTYLDKYGITRKDFADLFQVNEGFYLAGNQTANGLVLRTAPWARSSHLIKGAKYNRSMQIARKALAEHRVAAELKVYTAYSPDDPSYFVSGFETLIKTNEAPDTTEHKIKVLKDSWETTVQQMSSEHIGIWSK